ncbi:MAG: hypothetical protein U9R75_09625 [Candidatus Thermoplasmatota archaeon]|nr:hypothetical protein [Candidatus Thermoplasmatota archaeon]
MATHYVRKITLDYRDAGGANEENADRFMDGAVEIMLKALKDSDYDWMFNEDNMKHRAPGDEPIKVEKYHN